MEYFEVIQRRFSVRTFSDRPVAPEIIQRILEAGRLAPTAKNFQPERIWIIQSPEGLAKIRAITKSAYNAPVVLLIAAKTAEAWVNPYNQRNASEMDASIIGTHMMLAATDLGLGSVWVCWFDTEAVKKAFSLPEGIEPFSLLPLGYPAPDCVPNPRHFERKALDQIVGKF